MRILQVHDVDLIGRNFNGYDLQRYLNESGVECKQIVKKKYSNDEHVEEMESREYVEQQLLFLEETLSVNNLFPPYGDRIEFSDVFKKADIIHYHMIHHYLLSILDMPKMFQHKRSVWTIHDPWIFTGHCVHPLACEKWKTGCEKCERIEAHFQLQSDNAAQMWKLKQASFLDSNVDIVVSSKFMGNYLTKSPITKNLTNVHTIPFGIEITPYLLLEQDSLKKKRNFPLKKTVIGFRLDDNEVKGCNYIWEMLEYIETPDDYVFICIGKGSIPQKVRERFCIIEFGWSNSKEEIEEFHTICDIFLMPSLAESFGVMAIEAMAAKSTVICFKGTVLEEITLSPECGIAVDFADSKSLLQAVKFLHENKKELQLRGKRGRNIVKEKYLFCDYVENHIKLYEEIMKR